MTKHYYVKITYTPASGRHPHELYMGQRGLAETMERAGQLALIESVASVVVMERVTGMRTVARLKERSA